MWDYVKFFYLGPFVAAPSLEDLKLGYGEMNGLKVMAMLQGMVLFVLPGYLLSGWLRRGWIFALGAALSCVVMPLFFRRQYRRLMRRRQEGPKPR